MTRQSSRQAADSEIAPPALVTAAPAVPCTPCAAGKYAAAGQAACTNCPAGKYREGTGGSDEASCSACPSNSNSSAGSAALTSCVCNTGSASCGNTSNQSTTNNQSTNIPIITGAVVGGSALCILVACCYFRCLQSKHPADNAQHASNTAGHEDPRLTPVQQPQYQHRPPELNPFFGLMVGDVYSEPAMAGVLEARGVLPETKPQEEALRARSKIRSEGKVQGGVANEPTEDRDVFRISLEDLDLSPKSLASGSFKEVFLARLRKTIPEIGPPGHKVVVMKLRNGHSTLGAELKVFKTLGRHPNLTRLLAVTYSNSGVVTSLVTEFAELGSLDHVLTKLNKSRESATTDVLLTAAMQVLDGMLQLQEHKIVHCDLALRNILVFRFHSSDYDQVHVKITDYGLASTGT